MVPSVEEAAARQAQDADNARAEKGLIDQQQAAAAAAAADAAAQQRAPLQPEGYKKTPGAELTDTMRATPAPEKPPGTMEDAVKHSLERYNSLASAPAAAAPQEPLAQAQAATPAPTPSAPSAPLSQVAMGAVAPAGVQPPGGNKRVPRTPGGAGTGTTSTPAGRGRVVL